MRKTTLSFFLMIIFFNAELTAHKLPQQSKQLVENSVVSEHKSFTTTEIDYWYDYSKSLDIEEIAKRVNMPTLISYSSADDIGENTSPNVECSIYIINDEDELLCGSLDDDFSRAALSAIGYCFFREMLYNSSNSSLSKTYFAPYFKGPASFAASMNESTHSNHHNNYDRNHGLHFQCLEVKNNQAVGKSDNKEENL